MKNAFYFLLIINLFFIIFLMYDKIIENDDTRVIINSNEKIKIELISNSNENLIFDINSVDSETKITSADVKSTQSKNKTTGSTGSTISFNGLFIPIGIVSALISATVTFIMYKINRRNAKAQLKFDIALKNLLPSLYLPLLTELQKKRDRDIDLDINIIKDTILNNMILLSFIPDKLKAEFEELYSISSNITNVTKYKERESELVQLLENIENQITKRFGAFKG